MKTCVICKKQYEGPGHSASPVAEGQCCTDCNVGVVLPIRTGATVKKLFRDLYKLQLPPENER